jgi:hypothetical protein
MKGISLTLALIAGIAMASPALAQSSYYLLVPQNPPALSGHMQNHKVDNGLSTKPIPMVISGTYQTRAQCEQARNNTAIAWRKAHVSTQQWREIGVPSSNWMFQCMANNDPRLTTSRSQSGVTYLAPQLPGSHSQYGGMIAGRGIGAAAMGSGAVPPR